MKIEYGDQGTGLAERYYPANAGESVVQETCSGGTDDGQEIAENFSKVYETTEENCKKNWVQLLNKLKTVQLWLEGLCLERI